MSRPPIRRDTPSPRGPAGRYFAPGFPDLVALAEAVAADPGAPGAPSVEIPASERGLARLLIEASALLAHILGEHQSHYAAEAHLATARRAESLVAHARRLAYRPDHGRAATGLAAFTVKPGLRGEIAQGFALQSEPRGEARAQTYETLEALAVDAAWNRMRPTAARAPAGIAFDGDGLATLPLAGRHDLALGETVLLEGQGRAAACEVAALPGPGLVALRRLPSPEGPRRLPAPALLDSDLWPPAPATAPYVIRSRSALRARAFGWDADPRAFPPTDLARPDPYKAPETAPAPEAKGYTVAPSSGSYVPGASLILAEPIEPPPPASPLVLLHGGGAGVLRLGRSREAAVSFTTGRLVEIPQPDRPPPGFPKNQLVERSISGRVSLLDLLTLDGAAVTWDRLPVDAILLGDWRGSVSVATDIPNPAPLPATLALDADLSAMRPGRRVILRRLSDGASAAAQITRLRPPARPGEPWTVTLSFEGGAVPPFTLGDTELLGNCAPVSHGETRTEEIGGSDGTSPHQVFPLRAVPITRLPSAEGARPALEVRVDGVLWDEVEDFHDATPEDRAYLAQGEADGSTSVRFGGDGRGADPPAGRRNIAARYRVGLGRVGDAGPGRLTRMPRASPLLAGVTNPLPLAGGTDPAGPDDIRRQATRRLLTLDRAVSVQDHADLALLFPGVARAAARWLGGGVELVAADAEGTAPPDPAALRAFLDARRDAGVPLLLLGPQAVDVSLALRVERDRAYLADAVRLTVTEALIGQAPGSPGLFTFAARDLSQPQSLSGLLRHLLALPGVAGVEATRFALASGGPDRADILHATERQWLRLQPSDLALDIAEPGGLAPVAGEEEA